MSQDGRSRRLAGNCRPSIWETRPDTSTSMYVLTPAPTTPTGQHLELPLTEPICLKSRACLCRCLAFATVTATATAASSPTTPEPRPTRAVRFTSDFYRPNQPSRIQMPLRLSRIATSRLSEKGAHCAATGPLSVNVQPTIGNASNTLSVLFNFDWHAGFAIKVNPSFPPYLIPALVT